MHRYTRTNFLPVPRAQLWLAASATLTNLAVIGIIGGWLWLTLKGRSAEFCAICDVSRVEIDAAVTGLRHDIVMFVGIVAVAAVLGGFAQMLYVSQRIFGPLIPLRRALGSLAQGEEMQPIHLRKDDSLKDLAVLVNDVAERHRKKDATPPQT